MKDKKLFTKKELQAFGEFARDTAISEVKEKIKRFPGHCMGLIDREQLLSKLEDEEVGGKDE